MAPLARYALATLALASTSLAAPAPVPGSKVIRSPAEATPAAGMEIHIKRDNEAQGGWENHIKRGENEAQGGWENHIKRGENEAQGGWENHIKRTPGCTSHIKRMAEAEAAVNVNCPPIRPRNGALVPGCTSHIKRMVEAREALDANCPMSRP